MGHEANPFLLQGLSYLDMVVHESLRLFPIITIERMCVKDYPVPGTKFTIPKGMIVGIANNAIMRDTRYFPDPDNFNPDVNFSAESKQKRSPYAFLAFGQGPRNCIGMRFAVLNMKMALIKMLGSYRVMACDKTPTELIHEPTNPFSTPKGGTWVKVEKRKLGGS